MKAVCKKLFSLMLVAILLVSAVPFQALAAEGDETTESTVAATQAATEPTTAETTPVREGSRNVTEPAQQAAAVAPDKTNIVVQYQLGRIMDGGDEATDLVKGGQNYQVGSNVSAKTLSTAKVASGDSALNVLKTVVRDIRGYEFLGWYYEDQELQTSVPFTSSTIITEDKMDLSTDSTADGTPILNVFAEFKIVRNNITLDPAGGTVSTTKHLVQLGETYTKWADLPVPTRTNCTFLGWFNTVGERVDVTDSPIVSNLGKLTARWLSSSYNVYFQKPNGTGWETVEEFTFDGTDHPAILANAVLTVADGRFPSETQAETLFLDGLAADWYFDDPIVWKTDTGVTVTAGKTKITDSLVSSDGNIYIRPVCKRDILLDRGVPGQADKTLTVTYGQKLPVLPDPGNRDGYAFVGWAKREDNGTAGEMVVLKKDLSNVSNHPYYYGDLVAKWEESETILLNFYTNGNTKTPVSSKYYDVPTTEDFDLKNFDASVVFPSFNSYKTKSGWYTKDQWLNYVGGFNADWIDIVDAENIGKSSTESDDGKDYREFYIMLSDKKSESSTGNNYPTNSNADSSNPTTGDQIFMAVTVLAVSACALALIVFFKKRKAK